MIQERCMGKILVIDDEVGPRESLRILLKNRYEVFSAKLVDEGLELFKDGEFDLVIMDIRMPQKNGIEGLREIREADKIISIVMLTGFGELATAQEALRLGANDYIKKPFDAKDMLEVVEKNVQRSQLSKRREYAAHELKDLNNHLVKELAEKEHMATLGQASAEFVHDLRNPLTIVLGYVQLLTEQLNSAKENLGGHFGETVEYLDVIEKNVQRCHELAKMWQSFGKVTEEQFEDISLLDLMRDIVIGVEPLAQNDNSSIGLSSDQDVYTIKGSNTQLVRAIHNVIGNAIHAIADKQDGERLIDISIKNEEGDAVIKVNDNGCGMSPQDLEKSFDLYYTTKRKGKGTGLGLFITKKIIADHHGTIEMESTLGEGSLVTIRLPLAGTASPVPSS